MAAAAPQILPLTKSPSPAYMQNRALEFYPLSHTCTHKTGEIHPLLGADRQEDEEANVMDSNPKSSQHHIVSYIGSVANNGAEPTLTFIGKIQSDT
jgi:hypothetical protein